MYERRPKTWSFPDFRQKDVGSPSQQKSRQGESSLGPLFCDTGRAVGGGGGEGGGGVSGDFSRRHTAHFVPTPPAILRTIPPIKLINIPNALIQSSQDKCINPFTPQLLVALLIHNAFSIHYGYTLMFSLLKILGTHRTTTNRHDRLPTSPQLLSFDIVGAD